MSSMIVGILFWSVKDAACNLESSEFRFLVPNRLLVFDNGDWASSQSF